MCPLMMCTKIFIPLQCREYPVLEKDGIKCRGCQQWKPECRDGNAKLDVKTTSKSPARSVCPEIICTLEFIPDECREVPTVEVEGTICKGCPKWRKGCKETAASSVTTEGKFMPRLACPMLKCAGPIPSECKVNRTYTTHGQVCDLCPEWKPGCRENERNLFLNTPPGAVSNTCPQVICDNQIPPACEEPQTYDVEGRMCFGCPKWREGCVGALPTENSEPKIVVDFKNNKVACPIINCERVPGLHRTCYERQFKNMQGQICEVCPAIKPRCQEFIPPRPIVSLNNQGEPEVACPLMACANVNSIPKECQTYETYEFRGKTCKGCPKQIDGCLPSKPLVVNEISCPVKACALILIPPECRQEQPYQFQGKTCYDCPRWKEGCVPSKVPTPEVACPMLACPRIYIPEECREKQPFQFQGKTCFSCPKWREGCTPKGENENRILTLGPQPIPSLPDISCPLRKCQRLDVPAECIMEQTYQFEGKTCVDCPTARPDCPTKQERRVACPQIMCPTMHTIPRECMEEQTTEVDGQICKLCPKWRPGCKASEQKTTTTTTTNKNSADSTPVPIPLAAQKDTPAPVLTTRAPSLLDLNGLLPVRNIMSQLNDLSCPPLPCPDMLIPFHCREETTYQYQGRTCRGCPRWRLGCQPNGDPFTINPNGYELLLQIPSLFTMAALQQFQ